MLTYSFRRALYAIPILLLSSFLLFWLVRISYDPCVKLRTTREGAQAVARCEERLGLNHSVPTQYRDWLTNALQGDLGTSSRTKTTPRRHSWPLFRRT